MLLLYGQGKGSKSISKSFSPLMGAVVRKAKEGKMVKLKERQAKRGQKMIEVKVRFFTNDIATQGGRIIPKECWDSGVVRIARNKAHGIVPIEPIPFNSLLDLPAKMEQLFLKSAIKLHLGRSSRRYMKA